MLASCALDVKFHDWQSGECSARVSASDSKARGFLDINWCNEGTHLVAVPVSGKSIVITSDASNVPLENKDDNWMPTTDIVNVPNIKCAIYSKKENANLVVGTNEGEVLLYNTKKSKILQTFADLPSAVKRIEIGAQDLFVAAGCENGQIFVYKTEQKVIGATYFVPYSLSLTSMKAHSRIHYLLAGGSERGIVAIWNIHMGKRVFEASNQGSAILDMSFSMFDDSFITIGTDRKINIFDLRSSACVHEKQFETDLSALTYCPNSTEIAIGTGLGQIVCLDIRFMHSFKSVLQAHKSPVRKISFDTENLHFSNTPLGNYSKTAHLEVDCSSQVSADSEVKTPGSGDYDSYNYQRHYFNCNMYKDNMLSEGTSLCQIDSRNRVDVTKFHVIDENSLNQFRDDIKKTNKAIIKSLVEKMNSDFMQMRMEVSRQICLMEIKNKKRWQDFNLILLKIAQIDEDQGISDFEETSRSSDS